MDDFTRSMVFGLFLAEMAGISGVFGIVFLTDKGSRRIGLSFIAVAVLFLWLTLRWTDSFT